MAAQLMQIRNDTKFFIWKAEFWKIPLCYKHELEFSEFEMQNFLPQYPFNYIGKFIEKFLQIVRIFFFFLHKSDI